MYIRLWNFTHFLIIILWLFIIFCRMNWLMGLRYIWLMYFRRMNRIIINIRIFRLIIHCRFYITVIRIFQSFSYLNIRFWYITNFLIRLRYIRLTIFRLIIFRLMYRLNLIIVLTILTMMTMLTLFTWLINYIIIIIITILTCIIIISLHFIPEINIWLYHWVFY